MKFCQLFSVILLALSTSSWAEAPSKKAVEKMFSLTGMDQVMDAAHLQMDRVFVEMVEQMDIPAEKRPVLDKFLNRYNLLVRQEMSWRRLKDSMIAMYSQVYTAAEIEELIAFYETPLGQKVLKKTPELMRVSTQMTQDMMEDFMPKVLALQEDLARELAREGT